jgi:Undecaprenyl-phosphate glucose phosphotransferase
MSEMLVNSPELVALRDGIGAIPGHSHVAGARRWTDQLGNESLRSLISTSVRFADALLVIGAAAIAYSFGNNNDEQYRAYASDVILSVLLVSLYFQYAGLYRIASMRSPSTQISKMIFSYTGVTATLIVIDYLTKISSDISRSWSIIWFLITISFLTILRLGVWRLLQSLYRAGRFATPIAVMGSTESVRRLLTVLASEAGKTIRLVGTYDTEETDFGIFEQVAAASRTNTIDEILIPLPWTNALPLETLLRPLRNLPIAVRLIPEVPQTTFSCLSFSERCGLPAISVIERPLTDFQTALKRAEDLVISLIALAFAGPLMLLIALLVKLDSPGPALFRQDRWGFSARKISVLKFRTMKVSTTDDPSIKQATRDDARVTRIGRILRRTSLDELPQLLNVLRGDMSLVGPRPHAVAHNERYMALIDNYLGRHRVKPGITGLAQVNGCRGITDTIDKMERRVAYDLQYIDTWSIILDLKVMIRTVFVGFINKNAF